jgi:hypothetical protein
VISAALILAAVYFRKPQTETPHRNLRLRTWTATPKNSKWHWRIHRIQYLRRGHVPFPFRWKPCSVIHCQKELVWTLWRGVKCHEHRTTAGRERSPFELISRLLPFLHNRTIYLVQRL